MPSGFNTTPSLQVPRPNLNSPVPNLYNPMQNLLNAIGGGPAPSYQAPNSQHQSEYLNFLLSGWKVNPNTGQALSPMQASGRGPMPTSNRPNQLLDPTAASAAIDEFKGLLAGGKIAGHAGGYDWVNPDGTLSTNRPGTGQPGSYSGGGPQSTVPFTPPPAVGSGGGEVHAIQGAPLGDLTSRLGNQINPATGQPYNAQLATGGSGGIGPGNPQYQAIIDQQRGWGSSITDALRPGAPAHAGVPGLPAIGAPDNSTRARGGAALPAWMNNPASAALAARIPGTPPMRPPVPPPASVVMPPRRLRNGLI